jgi:hypothetical protein
VQRLRAKRAQFEIRNPAIIKTEVVVGKHGRDL